jgi:exodeoxyribonuclease VII large subunit
MKKPGKTRLFHVCIYQQCYDLLMFDPNLPSSHIYSVSELNSEVRELLEGSFPVVQVEGEISNFARPASGHMYFSLKDSAAQVRCAMFKNRNYLLDFKPGNGMQVLIRARVGLYEGRGEYQLIAEHMEEAGSGALQRAFEELKRKLSLEGLFDESRKKPLPTMPARVGIITSASGAALRDILHVLNRRFPALPVLIYPVSVQGERASGEIIDALETAESDGKCDVLILARGGGSIEDLWAFNSEALARAISGCSLPVVAGIGHETDFTIADFVSDLRAPTPSAAAASITPDAEELLNKFMRYESLLIDISRKSIELLIKENARYAHRLGMQHPLRRIEQSSQRVDELEQRAGRAIERFLRHQHLRHHALSQSLAAHHPANRLNQLQKQTAQLMHSLNNAIAHKLHSSQQRMSELARTLNAFSPLATIDRGYAIISTQETLIRSVSQLNIGDQVTARLTDGELNCTVDTIIENQPENDV